MTKKREEHLILFIEVCGMLLHINFFVKRQPPQHTTDDLLWGLKKLWQWCSRSSQCPETMLSSNNPSVHAALQSTLKQALEHLQQALGG